MNRSLTKLSQKIICLLLTLLMVFGMMFTTSFAAGTNLDPVQKFILEVIELDDKARSEFVAILEDITPTNYKNYVDDVKKIVSLNEDDITAALKAYANYTGTYKSMLLLMIENFALNEVEAKDYTVFGFRRILKLINYEITGDYYDDRGIRVFISVFKRLKVLTGKDAFYDDPSDVYKLQIKVGGALLKAELDSLIGNIQTFKNKKIYTFDDFIDYVEKEINSYENIEIYNFKRFLKSEGLGYSGALKKPDTDEGLSPIEKLYLKLISLSKAERELFVVEVLDKLLDGDLYGAISKAEKILGSMPKEDIEAALKAFASYVDDNKAAVKLAIKYIAMNIENENFDTSKFSDIAEIANFMFTGDYEDEKGFIIFVKIMGTLRGISTSNFIFDDKNDPYKIDFDLSKLKIYNTFKPMLDSIIKSMNSLKARGINSFDDYIAEFESKVNAKSNEQIYYFKKFLYEERLGYGGKLPNPNGDTPSPKPTGSSPSGGGGGGGGSSSDRSPVATPTQTPLPTSTPVATEPVPTSVPAANPFKDLEDTHWAKDNILELVDKKVLTGYPDGTIKPDLEITRAEMAVIIVKAIGLVPVENPDLKFKDKDQIGDWAAGYIQAAVENNIIVGYEDNTFRPSNKLTREEMIVMVMKAYKYEPVQNPELTFTDKGDIGSWSIGYVANAVELKFVAGYPDNTFRPKKNVTRAEVATVIVNCIEALDDKTTE